MYLWHTVQLKNYFLQFVKFRGFVVHNVTNCFQSPHWRDASRVSTNSRNYDHETECKHSSTGCLLFVNTL